MADNSDNNQGSAEGKLPAAIAKIADPVISKLEPQQRVEVRRVILQATKYHRGPLPDPETLRGYSELIKDGPERIMKLLESETAHRQEQERNLVKCHTTTVTRGQLFGLLLTIALGAAGYQLGMTGHDWLAGAVFTTTIVGVVTVFVIGRRADEEEEEADEPPQSPPPPQKGKKKRR